jgi:hypothetical protein
MKRIQFAITGLLSLVVASVMTSCSCNTHAVFTGKMVSEKRQISGFQEIEVNGSPTVYYTQSDSFSVKVKGPEDAVENILTEKQGSSLVIRNKGKFGVVNFQLAGDDELAVVVTSPDLVAVRVNGSGDLLCNKPVDTDKMDITLRGSGDIHFDDIICDRCEVDLIGSGDVAINRLEAQEVSASLIGSGDIKLALQKVDNTSLTLKGSGDIDAEFLKGCGSVSCDLNGSGDISLSGKVKHWNNTKHGSGDIDIDNLQIE